jgi:hypothetical protein
MGSMRCALAFLSAAVMSGAGVSAAHAADYTLKIDPAITISNLIAVDKKVDGTYAFSYPYTATQGFNSLTNPNLSPDATSYFLVGSYLLPGETRAHAFFTMNPYGASVAAGKRLDATFVGLGGENPVLNAVTTRDTAYLTTLANAYGNLLFTDFGAPTVSMQFSIAVPIGNTVPVPAAVSQGALMLGLLVGGVALKRFARRRTV